MCIMDVSPFFSLSCLILISFLTKTLLSPNSPFYLLFWCVWSPEFEWGSVHRHVWEIYAGVGASDCLDHWGEWHLFSQLSLHAQSPSGRGAALWAISSRMKHWTAQSYAGLVQVIRLLWIHNRVSPVCQPITATKSASQQSSSTSGAYNLSSLSSVMFSEPSTPESRILCTRTVVSLCTNHRPTQKAVFWQGPRAVIIHGYKGKYLEGSLYCVHLAG